MFLKSGDLSQKEILSLLENLTSDSYKFMIIETISTNNISIFNEKEISNDFISLNLFSVHGELKVKKLDKDQYRCVYLGNKSVDYPLKDYSEKLKDLNEIRDQIILWGEKKEGQNFFVEQEIPHYFNYPLEIKEKGTSRVILKMSLLKDDNGETQFFRYIDLEEVKEEYLLCR